MKRKLQIKQVIIIFLFQAKVLNSLKNKYRKLQMSNKYKNKLKIKLNKNKI